MATFVIRDGKLVEKPASVFVPGAYMPDIAEFRTTDGTPISSRSQLRAYEQRHRVRQIGDMAGRRVRDRSE